MLILRLILRNPQLATMQKLCRSKLFCRIYGYMGIVVTNTGNVPLFNVNVTDDKDGLIGNFSYLAVGESRTLNASGLMP